MLDLNHSLTWVIPISVLAASFVGSLHCVTMCGPLILNFTKDKNTMLQYQLGRLISYSSIGAIGGAIGASVFDLTGIMWVPIAAMGAIGSLLIVNGINTIRGHAFHFQVPKFMEPITRALWRTLYKGGAQGKLIPVGAGLLTVLLPCGHLYSFVIGAVATGSPIKGAAFMATFWLGTVPALGFGIGALKRLLQRQFKNSQRSFGYILLVAGFLGLFSFTSGVYALASKPANDNTGSDIPEVHCH